jgi:hypothetical protein
VLLAGAVPDLTVPDLTLPDLTAPATPAAVPGARDLARPA